MRSSSSIVTHTRNEIHVVCFYKKNNYMEEHITIVYITINNASCSIINYIEETKEFEWNIEQLIGIIVHNEEEIGEGDLC